MCVSVRFMDEAFGRSVRHVAPLPPVFTYGQSRLRAPVRRRETLEKRSTAMEDVDRRTVIGGLPPGSGSPLCKDSARRARRARRRRPRTLRRRPRAAADEVIGHTGWVLLLRGPSPFLALVPFVGETSSGSPWFWMDIRHFGAVQGGLAWARGEGLPSWGRRAVLGQDGVGLAAPEAWGDCEPVGAGEFGSVLGSVLGWVLGSVVARVGVGTGL